MEPQPTPNELLDQVRDALRLKHYSYRTEQAYVGWITRTTKEEKVDLSNYEDYTDARDNCDGFSTTSTCTSAFTSPWGISPRSSSRNGGDVSTNSLLT